MSIVRTVPLSASRAKLRTMAAFGIGCEVRLTWSVAPPDGLHTNPSEVTLTLVLPDGSRVYPTVINPSQDAYYVDYVPLISGKYWARWASVGTVNQAEETDFSCPRSQF
jgi:hypothetical protein